MILFPSATLCLWINCFKIFGYLDGLSLESVLHAPPGLFVAQNSSFDSGSSFGRSSVFTGLSQQLTSLTQDPDAFKIIFESYKKIFNKKTPATEDKMRMEIFKNQLFNVLNHNMKKLAGQTSYEKGINRFSDMTKEEVIAKFTGYVPPIGPRMGHTNISSPLSLQMMQGLRIPKSIDWRSRGAVSSVKDQGSCGSCTLFACTGGLESSWFLKHGGPLQNLSVQELMDCIPKSSEHKGCGGNDYGSTLNYQMRRGQQLEDFYPDKYHAEVSPCRMPYAKSYAAMVSQAIPMMGHEWFMEQAVGNKGPVVVTINGEEIMNYRSGVFDGKCDGPANHALLAVGYGTENGKDYWLIKNSWGVGYGEQGYLKIRRNYGNHCQIATEAFWILVT